MLFPIHKLFIKCDHKTKSLNGIAKTQKVPPRELFFLTLFENGPNVNEPGNPRSTSTTNIMDGCEQGLCSRLGEQLVQLRVRIRRVAWDPFREKGFSGVMSSLQRRVI